MTNLQATFLLWKFILLMTNAVTVFLTENCNFYYDNLVTKDYIFHGNRFWVARTADVFDCARVCIRRKSCQSFNFNTRTRMCGLNNDTSESSSSLTKEDGSLYSTIGVWPSQIDPDCYARPCEEDAVCIPGGLVGGSSCSYSCLRLKCEAGWTTFHQNCYYFGKEELSYEKAVEFCNQNGGRLVQVDSVEEADFLRYKLRLEERPQDSTKEYGYWNDLYEVSPGEHRWRTSNDSFNPQVIGWGFDQPSNWGGEQSCTQFYSTMDFLLADLECGDDNSIEFHNGGRPGRVLYFQYRIAWGVNGCPVIFAALKLHERSIRNMWNTEETEFRRLPYYRTIVKSFLKKQNQLVVCPSHKKIATMC